MGSMLQDRGRHQAPPQNEIPSKRFKEDNSLITETEIESSEELSLLDNASNTLESMNPINLAARVLSARAQLFHQFQNNRAILQQQQQHQQQKSFHPNNFDSQQKLCQLLQFAHFQAYLATMVSRSTKTE